MMGKGAAGSQHRTDVPRHKCLPQQAADDVKLRLEKEGRNLSCGRDQLNFWASPT